MTSWIGTFVPEDRQLIDRTIGEQIAVLVRERFPRDTAKAIERRWDLTPSAAQNVIKGHASERVITKAIKHEGWEFLEALGHRLTGQTHAEWEEARLLKIIEQGKDAEGKIRSLRARRELMDESALSLDVVGAGEGHQGRRTA